MLKCNSRSRIADDGCTALVASAYIKIIGLCIEFIAIAVPNCSGVRLQVEIS